MFDPDSTSCDSYFAVFLKFWKFLGGGKGYIKAYQPVSYSCCTITVQSSGVKLVKVKSSDDVDNASIQKESFVNVLS